MSTLLLQQQKPSKAEKKTNNCNLPRYHKAIDNIGVDNTLLRLQGMQITGHLVCYLQAYLQDKKLGSVISEAHRVLQVLLQGSILSPLLFNGIAGIVPLQCHTRHIGVHTSTYVDNVCICAFWRNFSLWVVSGHRRLLCVWVCPTSYLECSHRLSEFLKSVLQPYGNTYNTFHHGTTCFSRVLGIFLFYHMRNAHTKRLHAWARWCQMTDKYFFFYFVLMWNILYIFPAFPFNVVHQHYWRSLFIYSSTLRALWELYRGEH